MLKKFWKKIMGTKKIENEIPEGKKAKWINGVLTLVDESQKDNRPVTERIKTFEDACNELGEAHPLVLQYRFNYNNEGGWNDDGYTSDFESYLKLRIITAALNEGWKPQFTKDECRYFPWFVLYTQEEIDGMNEDEKSRVVYRSTIRMRMAELRVRVRTAMLRVRMRVSGRVWLSSQESLRYTQVSNS